MEHDSKEIRNKSIHYTARYANTRMNIQNLHLASSSSLSFAYKEHQFPITVSPLELGSY